MKDYRDVIIRPVITEESVSAMDGLRKYTFEVHSIWQVFARQLKVH